MADDILDLTGLECPLPAIRTKRRLGSMRAGERLVVLCTDPMAAIDIPFLLRQLGHELVSHHVDESILHFEVRVSAETTADGWPTA